MSSSYISPRMPQIDTEAYFEVSRALCRCAIHAGVETRVEYMAGNICQALFAGVMPLLYPTPKLGRAWQALISLDVKCSV
jgi:hypothetical protein